MNKKETPATKSTVKKSTTKKSTVKPKEKDITNLRINALFFVIAILCAIIFFLICANYM